MSCTRAYFASPALHLHGASRCSQDVSRGATARSSHTAPRRRCGACRDSTRVSSRSSCREAGSGQPSTASLPTGCRCGRPGIVAIRSLLDARDPSSAVPRSVFETRLLRVLKAAGLPTPTLQHQVRDDRRVVAIVDFAFPAARLAIEADGYRWHSGRARWEHDLARRNTLTSLGWRVLHMTWTDLTTNPTAMIHRIETALGSHRNRAVPRRTPPRPS